MITPSSGSAMFYFYTNKLNFKPEFLGSLRVIYALGSMFGIFMYNHYFKNIPFAKFFIVSTFISSMVGMT